jgi:hypothetical protein
MLSSEILEKQFGPTKLVIAKQNDAYRIIKTIAIRTGDVLELSFVTFDQKNISAFSHIHQQILDGESMGKAFKQAEVTFTRIENSVSRNVAPPAVASVFNADGQATIVDVAIYVGDEQTHNADIIEIYSPKVTWLSASFGDTPDLAFLSDLL